MAQVGRKQQKVTRRTYKEHLNFSEKRISSQIEKMVKHMRRQFSDKETLVITGQEGQISGGQENVNSSNSEVSLNVQ